MRIIVVFTWVVIIIFPRWLGCLDSATLLNLWLSPYFLLLPWLVLRDQMKTNGETRYCQRDAQLYTFDAKRRQGSSRNKYQFLEKLDPQSIPPILFIVSSGHLIWISMNQCSKPKLKQKQKRKKKLFVRFHASNSQLSPQPPQCRTPQEHAASK